jgi:hypothetical protein
MRIIVFFLLHLCLSHKPVENNQDFVVIYPFALGVIMWLKHLLYKPIFVLMAEFIFLELILCLVFYYIDSNINFSKSLSIYGNLLCSEVYSKDEKDKVMLLIVLIGTTCTFYHLCPWSLTTDSHLSAITTIEALHFIYTQSLNLLLRW